MSYKIQINDEVRDATSEEAAAIDAIAAQVQAEHEASVAALEARKAPLRRLGLTDEEINAVLGA